MRPVTMRRYIIRWRTPSGRIVDTNCQGLTARSALDHFRTTTNLMQATGEIEPAFVRSITGIFDASWFDGIGDNPEGIGKPEGVCLQVVD